MTEAIQRLEELVPGLPDLSGVIEMTQPGHIEYRLNVGTCIGFGLFNEKGVAVQRSYMSKGSIFPPHSHPEKEILIIISGRVKLDDGKELTKSEHCYFLPGEPHSVEAMEDAWLIGITVPAAAGYPDAG